MQDGYDVVIVGAAAIGASIADFLAADPDFDGSILLVDRDPSFARAATSLSAAALRMQFSNVINVQMARFSHDCMMHFAETMQVAGEAPRLDFHPRGDLFLAQTADQATTLRADHAVQIANGADVALLNPAEVETAFPHLRSDDLAVASCGRADEGGDNTALMAGLSLPVETRKRTLFVFDCAQSPEGSATVDGGRLPLLVEPNGVYCRPEGRYFLVGCSPAEDPEVAHDDFDPRYDEFEEIIWPTLAERSAAFEAIKVINQWAGHFDLSLLDHNPILGAHPELANFYIAIGFPGHGLMQAPAVGRGLADLVVHGRYRSLDLGPFGYERVVANRPFRERGLL